jgi:serine/threonine protein phosphatase 1
MKDNIYCIGDVHGCYYTLMALVKKLPKNAEIIFVGDLVDRGKNSKKVIEFIRKNNYHVVLGNHEKMMIEGVEEKNKGHSVFTTDWGYNGYESTINSYNRDFKNNALLSDIEWLKTLPLYLEFEDELDEFGRRLVVSHAPCIDHFIDMKSFNDEGQDFLKQYLEDVNEVIFLWNRHFPLKNQDKYFNVFGHNIVNKWIRNKSGEIKVNKDIIHDSGILFDKNKGFAAIDTGCFGEGGVLSCIEFPTMRVIQQKNIEFIS